MRLSVLTSLVLTTCTTGVASAAEQDLVLPDHRDTGRSTRLCAEQASPESADGVALAGEEWGRCIGALHANAARTAAFNITEAAQDLSTLIARHRRDGEVRLYAVSYRTQLALRMLQVAPQPLDGLVLDGLVPPSRPRNGIWDIAPQSWMESGGRCSVPMTSLPTAPC